MKKGRHFSFGNNDFLLQMCISCWFSPSPDFEEEKARVTFGNASPEVGKNIFYPRMAGRERDCCYALSRALQMHQQLQQHKTREEETEWEDRRLLNVLLFSSQCFRLHVLHTKHRHWGLTLTQIYQSYNRVVEGKNQSESKEREESGSGWGMHACNAFSASSSVSSSLL